jgi:hypothetical protein
MKANPKTGLAGAVIGMPVAFMGAPWAVGAAIVGAGAGYLVTNKASARSITEVEVKSVRRLRDERGQNLMAGGTYAAHPMSAIGNKRLRNQYINATAFHDHIISEQISHIAAYLRSKVPLRSLFIDVISEQSGKVYGVIPTSHGVIKGGVQASSGRDHSYSLELHDPVIQPASAGELFWMRLFPEIVSGIEGATGGRVTRSSKVSTSFGLQLDIAKSAGIDASWLQSRVFRIEASFG